MKRKSGKLANGIRYEVLPRGDSTLAAVCVGYPAGSSQDPAGKEGLSHLLEHLSFDSVAAGYRAIGAGFNGVTTHDYNQYSVRALPDQLRRVLELERRRMTEGSWSEDRLRNEVPLVAAEAGQRSKDPSWALSELVMAAAYPRQPYGNPVLGTPESLSRIGRADLEEFHAASYRPQGAVVTVAGGVDAAWAEEQIQQVLTEIPPRRADHNPRPLTAGAPPVPERVEFSRPGPVSHFHFCYRTSAPLVARNAVAMLAGVTALGGRTPWSATDYWGGKLTSALIRNAGCLGASVQFQTTRDPGPVHIAGSIEPSAQCVPSEETIALRIAQSLHITGRQLAAVKRQLALDWEDYSENPVRLSRWVTRSAVIEDGLGNDDWRACLKSLRPEEVEVALKACLSAAAACRGWMHGN